MKLDERKALWKRIDDLKATIAAYEDKIDAKHAEIRALHAHQNEAAFELDKALKRHEDEALEDEAGCAQ